jgi:peptidoglycan L-alanyl-D-glutamate endopeptidase CwlK
LINVLSGVIAYFDFSVLEGHRGTDRQYQLFQEGRSQIDGINLIGKHNVFPSDAVDIAPYPIDFSDRGKARERFYFLMGMIKQEAERQGVKLRFGLDWDGDGDFDDQSFDDLGHVEILS